MPGQTIYWNGGVPTAPAPAPAPAQITNSGIGSLSPSATGTTTTGNGGLLSTATNPDPLSNQLNQQPYNGYIAPAPITVPVTNAIPGSSQAVNGNAASASATTEDLNAPQLTIAGNIGKYIDPNSSINQMLKTKALGAANGEGTLNSSMTDSAISNGIIANAQSMAQQDQGVYSTGAVQNANLLTNTANSNAGLANQVSMANANAANQSSLQNAGLSNQVNIANADAANRSALQNSQLQSQQDVQQMSNASQQNIAQMSNANQLAMTNLNNSNKSTLQGSSAAVNIYQQAMNNISTIQNNTSMDQATKDLQVQNIISTTQAELNDQSAITGLNIGANFNGLGVVAANTTATDTTAAATAAAAAAAQPAYHYTPHGYQSGKR